MNPSFPFKVKIEEQAKFSSFGWQPIKENEKSELKQANVQKICQYGTRNPASFNLPVS